MGRIFAVLATALFAVVVVVSVLQFSTDRQRMIATTYIEDFDADPVVARCIAEQVDSSDLREEIQNALALNTVDDLGPLSEDDQRALNELANAIQVACA